jgi:integrase/recombinase XerD
MEELALTEAFRDDFIDYIVKIDERITSPNTIKSYAHVIGKIFNQHEVLNRDSVNEMLKKWNKTTKIKAVFSKMNEYFDQRDIDFTIKVPKNKRKERHLPEVISRVQLAEVTNKMPAVAKLMISCIFNIGAGLRISELINLEWENISWDEWGLENKTLSVKIRNSKRGKDRIIPIPHFTTSELYAYAEEIGRIDEDGIPSGGRIFDFGSDSFKPELKLLEKEQWEYEYVIHAYDFIRHNIINRYFKDIKNKHITAHSLRHSRASELYNVHKVPIAKIQQWLGHTDIGTTMIYIHLATEEDSKIMEKVGGI